ncbi:MAG: hypothetical protein ACXV2C_00715 [Candidatus Bathyarchaeia archaeon]
MKTEDLMNIMNFLCWLEADDPNALWGGVRIGDVMKSLQAMLGMPDKVFADIKSIALGQYDKVKTI